MQAVSYEKTNLFQLSCIMNTIKQRMGMSYGSENTVHQGQDLNLRLSGCMSEALPT